MGSSSYFREIKRGIAAALATCLISLSALADTLERDVFFVGAPAGLTSKLKILSTLEQKKNVFPTRSALRRAAKIDAAAFENALRAAGYYDGQVSFEVEERNENSARITFTIEDGGLFEISRHDIIFRDNVDGKRPSNFADLEIVPLALADGVSLQTNQKNFVEALWNNGFPGARIIGRRAVADFENKTAIIEYEFSSGQRAKFGEMKLQGDLRTREDFLKKHQNWTQGEVYEKSRLLDFRNSLSNSNLFDNIDVAPGQLDDTGTAPVLVTLKERKYRTVGAGVFFSTNEGPGVRLFFENRNLFRRAEVFQLEARVGQLEQSVGALLEKPLIGLPGTAFLRGNFINETTDAFDARTVNLSAGVSKYWYDQKLQVRGGLSLETTSVEPANQDVEERNFFVSSPISILWNNEGSILDPTKGVRASLDFEPTTGSQSFTQFDTRIRTRRSFGLSKKLTAAIQGRLTGTLGSSFENLPANKRFFSGGGGSVRGFGFQLAGPVDVISNDDGSVDNVMPIGGRSLIEGAFEARYKVAKQIQLAAFIDTASVSQSALPDFSQDFFVGVGVGARYLTPVGPLRIDFATPLNRRPTDNRVQFLISLGQAF